MDVTGDTQTDQLEFKILDRTGFKAWAKEGGRPARGGDGEIEKDEEHRELYGTLEESTIETELRILNQLDISLDIQGLGPANIPQALKQFKEYLSTKTPGRPLERPDGIKDDRRTHLAKGEKAGPGLSPATIERYLVACRRYYRFHKEVKEHRPARPVAKGSLFQGPPINSERRGLLLDPAEFNGWLETVASYQDYRPRYATWLIIAGVPIDAITSLRWGEDLITGSGKTSLRDGLAARELPRAGQQALVAPRGTHDGDLVFISSSGRNPNDDGELTLSGLRRLWTSARRAHQKRTRLAGPTMRDIKTVVENVDLRCVAGVWVYVERSATMEIRLRDKQPSPTS